MIRYLCILAVITCAALVTVFEEVEAVKVGYTIRKQEEARTQALDRARALKYNIACLKSPQNLERRLAAQRILLESPKAWQTLVMPGVRGGARPAMIDPAISQPSFFGRFFVGTARAESKELTNR